MEDFDITSSANFSESLNNLNTFIQKQTKDSIEKIKNDENKRRQDAIAFRNSQNSIIDRIKSDANTVKGMAGEISKGIKSYINSVVSKTQLPPAPSQPRPDTINNSPKIDVAAASRVVEERKSRIFQAVSRLTPFRQQVFNTIVSKARRDYGINKITKDLRVFQQVRGLYNIGDFSAEEYDNFYKIATSVTDIQDPEKADYFIDLIGKAAKRQGAGLTVGIAGSILNTVFTSKPIGFKSPVRNVGVEPVISRVDLEKISDDQIKSFYQKIIFRARPVGGGRFGVIISDGQRKSTIFELQASDQQEYRKAMQDRYLSQMQAKLRRTIKSDLSRSTQDFKDLERRMREERRRRG